MLTQKNVFFVTNVFVVKKISLCLLMLIVGFVFSCSKEFSFENHDADLSIKDSLANCYPISSVGNFKRDIALTDSNYLQVQVKVKRRGYYGIATNTSNGISFRDTGYITEGLHTLKLKGSGKPSIAGATTLKIYLGKDTCTFVLDIKPAANDPAIYNFENTAGKCTNASIEGEYKTNVALSATNRVRVQVNVLSTGSYYISTSSNGINFSAQGIFTSTGMKTVVLTGSGMPTSSGSFNFLLSGNTSNCNFSITVQPPRISIINQSDTAWMFSDGKNKFFGPFDQAYTSGATGATFLYLKGITVLGDSAMSISIQLKQNTVDTGTYFTRTNPHFTFKERYSLNTSIYRADPSTTGVDLKVVITSFDPVTRLINGTFSGSVVSDNGNVNITSGKFKAEVD